MTKFVLMICRNCYYYENGLCLNCDSPSDIREKKEDDMCDGGGLGADLFKPKEEYENEN